MERNPLIRPLGLAAGVLGCIESLSWVILSLVGIFIKLLEWKPDCVGEKLQTYSTLINCQMYAIYFSGNSSDTSFLIIHNNNFVIIAALSALLSFAWLCISIYKLIALVKRDSDKMRMKLIIWASIAGTIVLFDLIVTILLFVDYNKFTNVANKTKYPIPFSIDLIVVGIVMTISAKGFILWVVNAIFVYIIARFAYVYDKQDEDNQSFRNSINVSEEPTSLRRATSYVDATPTQGFGYHNGGYSEDTHTPASANKSFQFPRSVDDYNYRDKYAPSNQNPPTNFAKIGRSQRSSPVQNKPQNIAPPKIPTPIVASPPIPLPDYSPPPSPRLRPVLKSRNVYNY